MFTASLLANYEVIHTSGVCGHAGRTPDQKRQLVSQLLAAGVAVMLLAYAVVSRSQSTKL